MDAMQKILDAFTTFSTEIRGDIADLSSKVDVAAARETAAKDRAGNEVLRTISPVERRQRIRDAAQQQAS